MANEIFLNNNEKFHVFSKSPITPSMGLAQAVNKSGHTTTTSDVWSQDIPWFFSADDQATALTTGKDAKLNDLVLIGSNVFKRNETAYSDSAAFTDLWESLTLEDGTQLYNSDKEHVLTYHKGVSVTFLTTANNAKQASNYAGRVFKTDGSVIEQFVASTDKVSSGVPSTGYGVAVYESGSPLSEGEAEENFIANSYAGIIQFNTKVGPSIAYTADVFEYVGEKLNTSITELAKKVESVTTTAGEGVQDVTDDAKEAGFSVSTKTFTPEGKTDPVTVKALDIAVANVNAQGEVATDEGGKLVNAIGAQYIATKAASDAISGLDSTWAFELDNIELPDGVSLYQQNGKITDFYIRTANVAENGSVVETGRLVTAQDAQRIADAAVNALEIPEVADASTTGKGIVQLHATEIDGSETSNKLVPTVGAVAKSVKTLQGQIETIAGAGLNYHILGTSENLPAPSETHKGIVYLKKNTESEAGEYIEHLCVYDGTAWKWEQIGSTKTNLTDYVQFPDLAGYVKTITVNDNYFAVTKDTTDINLGTVVNGFYATVSSGSNRNVVPNSTSIRAQVYKGNVDIGVIDATSTDKGLVTLTSTYNATDEASAVTGKAVASAISGIDKGVTGITVNNGSKQTGDVTLNVVTGFANSTNYDGSTPEAISVRDTNGGGGMYEFYVAVASSTNRGVTRFYDKFASELGSDQNATVSERTVKSVYDTLYAEIPTTYVSTVNGQSGAITLAAGGNDENTTTITNSGSQSNLWGLNAYADGQTQKIVDGFIGGFIGSTDYAGRAYLPAAATKVIGNFVYNFNGVVIDTIRAERMVSQFYGNTATGLTEWVADMPNNRNSSNCFDFCDSLTTFIGDLSSLEWGFSMFQECSALETFIGDLSSLENGTDMFGAAVDSCCKLNAESVECILESIPTYTEGSHNLGLGIHVDAVETFNEITGAGLLPSKGESLQDVSYKGWMINVYVSNAD